MISFKKSTFVFAALAVTVFTANISVQAMEPVQEVQEKVFAGELALLEGNWKCIEIDSINMPKLYKMVQELASKLDIEMPTVYVIRNEAINAKATGKSPLDSCLSCCTKSHYIELNTGLFKNRLDDEIEHVAAHELSHLKLEHSKRGFTFFLKITPILLIVSSLTTSSYDQMVAPYVFGFILFMFSFIRDCEKEADLLAVQTVGCPNAALSHFNKKLLTRGAFEKFIPNFLSTHPDTEARIEYVKAALKKND